MSKELEREDRLDEKLSGQSHDERLIDSVCAELNAMAFDLKAAHTVNGDWPGSERDILEKHDHLKRMAVELRKLKAARAQGVTAAMTRIAKKKLEQMGATVHGVLAKNEVGRWVAVSESGRVMWLDNFEGRDSSVQPEQPSAGVVPEVGAMADILGEELRRTQAVYLTQVTLVDMIRKMLTAAPTAPAVQGGGVPVAWRVSHPDHAWRVYDAYPSWAEGEFQIDPLYTHPHTNQPYSEQGGEWVRCDERLPTEADGNLIWSHDQKRGSVELCSWAWSHSLFKHGYITHWKPTGLTRPQPPKSKEGCSHE